MSTYAIAATPPIAHLEGEPDACAAARRTPWIIAGILLAGFAVILAVLYAVVAEYTDAGAAIRHLLLGAITALAVLAGATPIAGAAIRPMIERQIRAQAALNDCLRREAQAAAEIALLRSTVSGLTELPQDVSRDVAAQIRPLAERVTAVEETVEDMSTAAAIVSQAASANGRVTPLRTPDGHRRGSG